MLQEERRKEQVFWPGVPESGRVGELGFPARSARCASRTWGEPVRWPARPQRGEEAAPSTCFSALRRAGPGHLQGGGERGPRREGRGGEERGGAGGGQLGRAAPARPAGSVLRPAAERGPCGTCGWRCARWRGCGSGSWRAAPRPGAAARAGTPPAPSAAGGWTESTGRASATKPAASLGTAASTTTGRVQVGARAGCGASWPGQVGRGAQDPSPETGVPSPFRCGVLSPSVQALHPVHPDVAQSSPSR